MLAGATLVDTIEEARLANGDVRITYDSEEAYKNITDGLGTISDWREGTPRGAYHGVVPLTYRGKHIFIGEERNPFPCHNIKCYFCSLKIERNKGHCLDLC
jgi:GNT-I family